MNSMMFMREDGQMGTCRICGKNFGLIGGYMEEFTGERLNVCVDCIKKFRQISEEDSSRVRTIVDDLISSCNNEKTLPILKKYKAKAVADSQMKEQIAIMKKREVEKTPDIIVTTCDLKEDYEVVAPVYFQLSNKGVFSSTYSRLAAEYSSKLQQLKEQGMLANRKADWGFLYGEYSVGQNDFDRAFYIAVEELKKQAARIDADAVISMRQDIDLDTKNIIFQSRKITHMLIRYISMIRNILYRRLIKFWKKKKTARSLCSAILLLVCLSYIKNMKIKQITQLLKML